MSRKIILSLVAIGTLASAALATGAADAMVANRGGNNRPPIHRINPPHFHHHIHFRHSYGHFYVRPVGYATPVTEAGPCTCLWKGYTPDGSVVFKDLCTKEMASTPVDGGPAQASELQAPTNFGGRTYQDYLAANPQAAPAEPKKN